MSKWPRKQTKAVDSDCMKLVSKSSSSGLTCVSESLKVRVEWFSKCEFIDCMRSSLTPLCPLRRKSCTPWRWPTTYSASCVLPAKCPSGTRPSTWRRESPTAREVSDRGPSRTPGRTSYRQPLPRAEQGLLRCLIIQMLPLHFRHQTCSIPALHID